MFSSGVLARVPSPAKLAGAAVFGALAGLVGTAAALGSLEFGVFGAIAGAVGTTIAAAGHIERSEA